MEGRSVFFVCVLTCALVAVISATESRNTDDNLLRDLIERVQRLESRDRDQQAEIDDLRSRLAVHEKRTFVLERIVRQLKKKSNGRSKVKADAIRGKTENNAEETKIKYDVTSTTDDIAAPDNNRFLPNKDNGNYL